MFDGPPDHISPRFVEVETSVGFSVKAGEWNPYGDYWKLGPFFTTPQPDRTAELEAALREARDTLQHYLHGGSSYRKPADAPIATINQLLKGIYG